MPYDYNVSAHGYMFAPGEMEAGEDGNWLCVDVDKHAMVQIFDTEDQMRAHLLECHGIPRTDKISMYKAMDNIWQVIASISVPRHNLNALIANERVYILGGEQRVSDEVRIAFFFIMIDDLRLVPLESFLSSALISKTNNYFLLFRPCHCIQDSRHLSLFDYCIYSSVFK